MLALVQVHLTPFSLDGEKTHVLKVYASLMVSVEKHNSRYSHFIIIIYPVQCLCTTSVCLSIFSEIFCLE